MTGPADCGLWAVELERPQTVCSRHWAADLERQQAAVESCPTARFTAPPPSHLRASPEAGETDVQHRIEVFERKTV
jgi:hypothetical protein